MRHPELFQERGLKQFPARSSLISSGEYPGGLVEDFQLVWPFMIPIVGTICTFAFLIVLTLSRSRTRELEIRERIAMIERGLMPPPEVDPRGFDRAMRQYDRYRYRAPGRHRRAGVTLMGIGFGLVFLIGIAGGAVNEGIGVGGFLVIVGFAFFINSLFEPARDEFPSMASRPPGANAPAAAPEPPRPE
jgi:hypothetical protein